MIMYDGHLLYRLLSSGEYFKRRVNVSHVKKLPIKKMSGNSFKKKLRRGVKDACQSAGATRQVPTTAFALQYNTLYDSVYST